MFSRSVFKSQKKKLQIYKEKRDKYMQYVKKVRRKLELGGHDRNRESTKGFS